MSKVATIHARNVPPRDQRNWVTGPELTCEAGITYRQADYWTRTGLLTPIDEPTPGTGHLRRYPEIEVQRAIALRQLLDGGMSLPVCRLVIDDLLRDGIAQHGALVFHLIDTTSTGAQPA